MGDADNVRVGADGAVAFAPAGSTLPTAWDDTLDGAFADLGFVSDDGCTETIGASTTDIKNWKGDAVRTVQTEHKLDYKLKLIETTDDTEDIFYGSDPAAGIEGVPGKRGCWVIDVFDGDPDADGVQIRVVIPDGQVTERGDVVYKNDQAIGYEITITCYPDDTAKKAYKYKSTDGS